MMATTFALMVLAMIVGTVIGVAIPSMSHEGIWMGAILVSLIVVMTLRVIAKFNK